MSEHDEEIATLTLNGEKTEVKKQESIQDACEEFGVPFACSEGICGTCCVTVKQGKENLSPFSQQELDFFGDDTGDERLACQCQLSGDAELEY